MVSFASYACTKDIALIGEDHEIDTPDIAMNSGILVFASPSALQMQVDELRTNDKFEVDIQSVTRAGNSNFTSLRQSLIEQGLCEFSDAELQEILDKGLIYEPDDEIIADPYLTAVLNADREVMVGNKVYRYVETGVVSYVPTSENIQTVNSYNFDDLALQNNHGISTNLSNEITFTGIAYSSGGDGGEPNDNDSECLFPDDGGGSGGGGGGTPPTTATYTMVPPQSDMSYNSDGSITLTTGVKIHKDYIKKTQFAKGNGDANWIQSNISWMWGASVVLENNFNSNHRMKLRMYDQDYIIYRAMGMTVRMQEKTLGIWWRKSAQEFRYGWSAVEVEYTYNLPAFTQPQTTSPMVPPKYPPAMEKHFPFKNKDGVLFHIPFVNYDITNGDVNKVLAQGLKSIIAQEAKKKLVETHKNSPQGLYTSYDNDKKVIALFPAGEDFDYNEGREVVRWDLQWFRGNFMIYWSSNGGFDWSKSVKVLDSAIRSDVRRARVFAAVKYGNQWRACIIETK